MSEPSRHENAFNRAIARWARGGRRPSEADLSRLIAEAAEPLPDFSDQAFGALFDRLGSATVVCLGEATHGTSEFYRARAAITRRLVERHGFTVVAVEADWPDAARIDRYVRGRGAPPDGAEPAFSRFPTWMWRNKEMEGFIQWLRMHNEGVADRGRKVGFYGIDLYSLGASVKAVLDYLDRTDPELAKDARRRYGCLNPWAEEPAGYGRAAILRGEAPCEGAVAAVLNELLHKRLDLMRRDGDEFLDAQQNAKLIQAAEQYYRAMYYASTDSWNLRDTHMVDTLKAVLAARGPGTKAVVWAHNSHLGDAAATEMGEHGEINVGHLCRETWGDAARLVGFGTDRGVVAAADDWDGAMRFMRVKPARDDSYERLCRDSGKPRFLLDLAAHRHQDLAAGLTHRRLERAIGVIYRPETERMSHYFQAELPYQFDHYVWFEETTAVTPLPGPERHGAPDTWPFAV
ncbi:MAG TPA: erythromycin esterase family protein [Azospirillaceae bacterium]|nr:erythromycin esterase family protein [Azospirillaceae bacterium]